nr:chorismate-binding protein [Verrucomicrobiota bacterium]
MTALPLQPSLAEFRELAQRGNLVPIYTEVIADAETPVAAFQKIDDGRYSFLLESVEKSDQAGRYSFVGTAPRIIFESRGRTIRITESGRVREFETSRDPLHELETLMQKFRLVPSPAVAESRFAGGAVGYLSYDAVRFFEPSIGPAPPDEMGLPETLFMIADTVLIFDHRTRRLRILANAFIENGNADEAYARAGETLASLARKLAHPAQLPVFHIRPPPLPISPSANTTPEEYQQIVRQAQEYIRAGDVFQIVPSQRFETEYEGDPLTLYRSLRLVNPSPYMFCLKLGGEDAGGARFALVGSSPEVHVRAMNGRVEI